MIKKNESQISMTQKDISDEIKEGTDQIRAKWGAENRKIMESMTRGGNAGAAMQIQQLNEQKMREEIANFSRDVQIKANKMNNIEDISLEIAAGIDRIKIFYRDENKKLSEAAARSGNAGSAKKAIEENEQKMKEEIAKLERDIKTKAKK